VSVSVCDCDCVCVSVSVPPSSRRGGEGTDVEIIHHKGDVNEFVEGGGYVFNWFFSEVLLLQVSQIAILTYTLCDEPER